MINLMMMSKRSQEDIVYAILNKYPDGLTPTAVAEKLDKKPGGSTTIAIKKILYRLEENKKIKILNFGRCKLCKVIK